jgi:hypothetical protein
LGFIAGPTRAQLALLAATGTAGGQGTDDAISALLAKRAKETSLSWKICSILNSAWCVVVVDCIEVLPTMPRVPQQPVVENFPTKPSFIVVGLLSLLLWTAGIFAARAIYVTLFG